jgi:hypothetical protein
LMDELFLNRDSKGRIEGRNNEFKKQTWKSRIAW